MAHYQLTGKLDRLLDRKVWLDCGAYLIIDRTEAHGDWMLIPR